MEVKVNKLPKSQAEIRVEMDWQEFKPYCDRAVLKLSKGVALKGFRPGKAPQDLLEKEIGSDKILLEAADLTVKQKYPQIIKENNLEPIMPPQVEILKLARSNPFCFKVKVEVLSEVNLPDYKKIASSVKKGEVKPISNEEANKTLKWLQESRGAKELNDQFAKDLGNFENLEQLKQSIEQGILLDKQRAAILGWREEVLEKIAQQANFEPPQGLLSLEKERMWHNLKNSVKQELKVEFEDYLKKINKTQEQLKKDIEQAAKKQVSRLLIFREIGKRENIKVEDAEIEQYLNSLSTSYPQADKSKIDKENLRGIIYEEKLWRRLFPQL